MPVRTTWYDHGKTALGLSPGSIAATPGDSTVQITQGTAPSGGTASYTRNLYRSTTNGVRGSLLSGDVTLPYNDNTVVNDTTYWYTLEVDDGVSTEDTTQVSAMPVASSEPFYGDDGSDVLIFTDDFDSYTGITSGGNPVSSNYDIHSDGNLGFDSARNSSLAAGRGGSGLCLQMDYFAGQEGSHPFAFSEGIGTPTHFFYQYWFKTSVGWKLDQGCCGVKGVVFDLAGEATEDSKYEHAVNILRNPSGVWGYTRFGPGIARTGFGDVSGGYVWDGREDDDANIPFDSDDPAAGTSPWPGGLNDGNWHRLTLEYQIGDPGYCKAWMDGVLFFDSEGLGYRYSAILGVLDIGWGYTDNWVRDGSLFVDDVTVWRR